MFVPTCQQVFWKPIWTRFLHLNYVLSIVNFAVSFFTLINERNFSVRNVVQPNVRIHLRAHQLGFFSDLLVAFACATKTNDRSRHLESCESRMRQKIHKIEKFGLVFRHWQRIEGNASIIMGIRSRTPSGVHRCLTLGEADNSREADSFLFVSKF